MYIIAGLGNPGLKYSATRHNVGFEVIERFAYENNIEMNKKKHKAIIGDGVVRNKKVILVTPQTYMNRSGESLAEIVNFYKVPTENVLVIYDDISLDVGMIRIRQKGSAGGHNGIKNIIQHLGTDVFPRIKVGVGNKPPGWDLADYVLSRYTKEEIEEIVPVIKTASEAIVDVIDNGILSAMNIYNQKKV